MIKNPFGIKGETLVETIIALSVLAMGIAIASSVVLNSVRNMAIAKQRIIAVNIAREGIEAVRSIRDTNWLLFSDRRRQCWNNEPGVTPCDGNSPIEPGYYVVYKHTDGPWHLDFADLDRDADEDGDSIFDNDVDPDIIKLSLVDIDTSVDSDGLDPDDSGDGLDDDTDMYNHKDSALSDTFGTEVKSSRFSRYIIIEYLENQPDLAGTAANDPPIESINTEDEWDDFGIAQSELNRMRVTSVVEWIQKGNLHSIELKTILTDYLGREDLTS